MERLQKYCLDNNIIEEALSLDKYDVNKEIKTLPIDELYTIGVYFLIRKNYIEMKKYLKLSSEKGYLPSIRIYVIYLLYFEENIKTAYRFVLLANSKGDHNILYELIEYFYMKRYLKEYIQEMLFSNILAIDTGYVKSMHYLGKYYEKICKKYDKMEEYYLMAIKNNEERSLSRLIRYYIQNKKYAEINILLKNIDNNFIQNISCSIIKKSLKIFGYENNEEIDKKECTICFGIENLKKPCHKNHLICITCLYNCKEYYNEMKCCLCRKEI